MGVKPQEILGYLLVARSIERIADHAKKLADNTQNIKDNIDIIPKIADIHEQILKVFDESITAFHRNKFEHANEVVNKSKSLGEHTAQLTQEIFTVKADAMTIVSLAYIVDSIERTRAYVLDIAETAINHQFITEVTKR
jgi:phosphate uptake regulator